MVDDESAFMRMSGGLSQATKMRQSNMTSKSNNVTRQQMRATTQMSKLKYGKYLGQLVADINTFFLTLPLTMIDPLLTSVDSLTPVIIDDS